MSLSLEPEIYRPAAKPFPRYENGLISLESYLQFLPDPPDRVPFRIPSNFQGNWLHQHVYFQERVWRQAGLDLEFKQMEYIRFRNSTYNQLIMRRRKELKAHLAHEEHTVPPPENTIHDTLTDFKNLDDVGAAAVGSAVALKPEVLGVLLPGIGLPKNGRHLSIYDKVDLLQEKRDESLQALEEPSAIPQRLATSALVRIAGFLRSLEIEDSAVSSVAQSRLEADHVYFPVRLPSLKQFYDWSNVMLKEICPVEPVLEEAFDDDLVQVA